MATQTASEAAEQRSAGQLVTDLSEQTSRLVRQEMELARAELQQKGKQAGIGLGVFGSAGVFLLFAVGALTAAAILLLSRATTNWLAALVLAGALALIAGVAALVGKTEVSRAVPPIPEQTIAMTRQSIQLIQDKAKEGRS